METGHKLNLVPLDGTFAVCRLAPDAPLHAWVAGGPFVSPGGGTVVSVHYMSNPNANVPLHQVGESYGVKKHKSDAPHWSYNGR